MLPLRSEELKLRSAAKKVVIEVNKLKMWRGLDTAEIDSTACWREIGRRWLPAVFDVLDALRACRQHHNAIARGCQRAPPLPADALSLQELTAIYTALELVALWGVTPLVVDGLWPLNRTKSRAALIPDVVHQWGMRNAMAARGLLSEIHVPDRASALQLITDVLLEVIASGPLAPVASRFASDALAASLSIRKLRNEQGACPFLDRVPLPWACAAIRKLLGSCSNEAKIAVPALNRCRGVLGTLLGDVTKRSIDCVLMEFASVLLCVETFPLHRHLSLWVLLLGIDELSGCQSAEAGRVEARVAVALAAMPVGEDAPFYVRAVAPQLVAALITRPAENSDGSLHFMVHSRVVMDALSQLHERGFSHIMVTSLLGQFGGAADETGLTRGLSALVTVSQHTAPGVMATLAADSELIKYLVRLIAFAKHSHQNAYVLEAAKVLHHLIEISSNPAGIIFDAVTRPCVISFGSGPQGGILSYVSDVSDDIKAVDSISLLQVLNAPVLVGALFALCLKKILRWRQAEITDVSCVVPTLKLATDLSTQLNTDVLTTPSVDLIQTLGLLLSCAADGAGHASSNLEEFNLDGTEEDAYSLERVALETLLRILELSSRRKHSFEAEKALKALLPSLAALSCPNHHDADLSQVATHCRALIISRNCRIAPNESVAFAAHEPNDVLAATASSLASPLPALRAFGVVQLTRLCESFTLDRDRRLVHGMNLPRPISWCLIADVLLQALRDQESYVYLAAAHALAAVADTNPREVLPWILYSLRTSGDGLIKMRLGEALMVTIRRRGESAPAYTRILSRSLCRGARYDQPMATRHASLSLLGELCGVAGLSVQLFALDLCDLVSSILASTTEGANIKRAASYLGHCAIAGCGQPLLENAPRDCALMCKRLRTHALHSADKTTQAHANDALIALDALLVVLLYKKQLGTRAKDAPLVYRNTWLPGNSRQDARREGGV